MNTITICGRITEKPEIKSLADERGTKICTFVIADNMGKNKKGEQNVLFLDCKAFGNQANFIHAYFDKGSPIMLMGRLEMRVFETKDGSGKRRRYELVVDKAGFVPKPAQSVDGEGNQPKPQERPAGNNGRIYPTQEVVDMVEDDLLEDF